MKILSKTEFLKLPAGTVYCCNDTIEHVGFIDLKIKGDTCAGISCYAEHSIPADWYERRLTYYAHSDFDDLLEKHQEMLVNGKSYPLEIHEYRNGLYEKENIFLVYEQDDLRLLIDALSACMEYNKVAGGNK